MTEKVWTILGLKFGKDVRKTAGIVRFLYVVAAFRSYLAKCIESLGYQSCKADMDLWLKPEIRTEDGLQYYSYSLSYVDDILCIHHNVDSMLERLHQFFSLKLGFGNPDMYLGIKLHETRLHNGVLAWAMSPVKCIQEAVRNC